MPYKNILTVIVNHNHNEEAIQLKKNFTPYCDTLLLDSGSDLTESEKQYFDETLSNVYYNGLLNCAFEKFSDSRTCDYLLFITSDVKIRNPLQLLERISLVLDDVSIGVYSPSTNDSCHNHMNNKGSAGLRKVTFTEGFCFAVRRNLIEKVCPIDTTVNKIGHGVDIYLGYLAMLNHTCSVVDDRVLVYHPNRSGYADVDARRERDAWFATKSGPANMFHRFVSNNMFKNKIGYLVALSFMKLYSTFSNG